MLNVGGSYWFFQTSIRNPCYFCTVASYSSLPPARNNQYQHAATIPNWNSEINMTFNSVTLARTIYLRDDSPRTETCRSVFNILMF